MENPPAVPVSKQTAADGDAHPEHDGRGEPARVCANGYVSVWTRQSCWRARVITVSQLWALLHFIMPTLFDSHEEFNEWFSKDIESHAENKSAIDESEYGFWGILSFVCKQWTFVYIIARVRSCSRAFIFCVSDQLSRLHMILKPFMLRRIKKDVENELSDKVEEETPSQCGCF